MPLKHEPSASFGVPKDADNDMSRLALPAILDVIRRARLRCDVLVKVDGVAYELSVYRNTDRLIRADFKLPKIRSIGIREREKKEHVAKS
jgi:hypothetical protein